MSGSIRLLPFAVLLLTAPPALAAEGVDNRLALRTATAALRQHPHRDDLPNGLRVFSSRSPARRR